MADAINSWTYTMASDVSSRNSERLTQNLELLRQHNLAAAPPEIPWPTIHTHPLSSSLQPLAPPQVCHLCLSTTPSFPHPRFRNGTYYVSERKLTLDSMDAVMELLKTGRGCEVVRTLVEVSEGGRAAKQDPGVLVLAMCLRFGDEQTKNEGLEQLESFMNAIGKRKKLHVTMSASQQMFAKAKNPPLSSGDFFQSPNQGKGWGRGMRKAVSEWYNTKTPDSLLYLVTKYRNRCGWTHKDVLRLAHVMPKTRAHDFVFRYLTHGFESAVEGATGDFWREKRVKELVSMENESTLAEMWPLLQKGVVDDGERPIDGWAGTVEDDPILSSAHSVASAQVDPLTVNDDPDDPVSNREVKKKRWTPTPKSYPPRFDAGKGRARRTLLTLQTYHRILHSTDCDEIVKAIREHHLAREHLPTEVLNNLEVWRALLEDMPFTAMLRNLGKMTSVGLLTPLGDSSRKVVEVLSDCERLRKARVHPVGVLMALTTYRSGRGVKGSLTWDPVPEITAALEDAFYASFGFVKPAGKRFLVAIDVSGSMCARILGTHLQCRMAAAALAMVLARTEPRTHLMAFGTQFVPLDITARDSLDTVMSKCERLGMMGTDCGLPMIYAEERGIEVDAFVVITDCETYAGRMSPMEALKSYRDKMGIDAKMVVIGMTSGGFTIADPDDAGMLDVVGFDTNVPNIIRDFVTGTL
ncbi:hypothetical protein BC829DRAFT_397463 [Chytridium lagenaria]|nr:hypothetical protein BC829DRAFT_397463 [Chytridium lagenaria]